MATMRFIAPLIAAGLALAPVAAGAVPGLNERVVADPASGIALYGYDPVAYFTEGKPVLGSRAIEAEWGGSAWRFASEANRAAFLSAPEAYAPSFGGYDPTAVARGVISAGHPLLFRVAGEKLYLFRSTEDRDNGFDVKTANHEWLTLSEELTD